MPDWPELHYRWDGPVGAPVLVLSHSIGTSMAMWDPQIAELAVRFRVLRYDHRGHGRSAVPTGPYTIAAMGRDFLELLDRERLERVAFCGLSLGGMVGIWVAATKAERIDRLVLCSTAARMLRPEAYAERAARVRREGLGSIADAVLGRWFTPEFARQHPGQVAWIRTILLSTPTEGYAAACEALAAADLRSLLTQIRAPTLVIAGAEDKATPVEQGGEIAEHIDDAKLVVIPGAAHLANIEQPTEVTRRILSALTEGRTARGER